jgi:hypothetical protein
LDKQEEVRDGLKIKMSRFIIPKRWLVFGLCGLMMLSAIYSNHQGG